jgi:CBS-domain-containing membrane protein
MDVASTLPLHFNTISGPVALPKSARPQIGRQKESDPATAVMTDFTASAMFSINQDVQIDQAMLYMKAVGVKLLFVLNGDHELRGLITTTDIQGGRPTRYMLSLDGAATRRDVLVKHIMSALHDWKVLDYRQVQKATIGQIVATFKDAGMRHLVVTDGPRNAMAVRGVISATRVEQALGRTLDIVQRASTFAEIEHAVAHS